MVNELMKLTLLLCIVVGPILFISEILLKRMWRTASMRLCAVQFDQSYAVLLRASARAQEQAQASLDLVRGATGAEVGGRGIAADGPATVR